MTVKDAIGGAAFVLFVGFLLYECLIKKDEEELRAPSFDEEELRQNIANSLSEDERRCPDCFVGRNSVLLGGSLSCFHCGEDYCGYAKCEMDGSRPTLTPDMRIKFVSEKQRYTVQASNYRYAICTKPFNPRKTVLYTIVDLKLQIRGNENLVFGHGAETRKQCEDMLQRLSLPEHPTTISRRNSVNLDIERIDPAKESK